VNTFTPKMNTISAAQMHLWPLLKNTKSLGFVLYGGTAVALQLGHRESVDFDFFAHHPLDQKQIINAIPFLQSATTLQDEKDTWVVLVQTKESTPIKLSFFGSIQFGRAAKPLLTNDQILYVASLDDLMATKLKVILQRAEKKDYLDILAMLQSGQSLERGLATGKLFFRNTFQPGESLKALTYFDDGDLSALSQKDKDILIKSVERVSALPEVSLESLNLSEGIE